jgi:hypothetical protein
MFNLLKCIFSKKKRLANGKEVVEEHSSWSNLTWKCEICGKIRPDDKISVVTYSLLDEKLNITRNLKYCNDNLNCIHQAQVRADSKRM